jgi:hypothetical protein
MYVEMRQELGRPCWFQPWGLVGLSNRKGGRPMAGRRSDQLIVL